MSDHIKKITKHKAIFSFANNANKCLELADDFLENNPEILYWTEPNESKKGVFYMYENGIYKERSTFEIENILLSYTPSSKGLYLPRSLSQSKFNEVMNNIKRRRFFYRELFNQENIINFANGMFDIVTGDLLDHTMDIISTIQLPYNYDKDAECPIFLKVLNESLEGDLEKIGLFQEFVGYCFTKSTKYEKALFLIGEACSGKSTMLDAIEAILGEQNCSSVRMDMLGDSRFVGNLLDKYANIDNEIPQNIENYEDSLKKIISGQKITVNTKFIPTYDAKPFCKLIFAANDFPRIRDTSNAIFRRLILLDFNNIVEENKIDVNLKYKIKKECPGIFNWAFEGLKRLRENNRFSTSKDMIERIDELKLLNNNIYYFIEEKYDVTSNFKDDYVLVEDMYTEYKNFCHEIGAKGIYKKPTFSKELNKVYVKKIKQDRITKGGGQIRVWRGIRKKGINETGGELTWED